MDNDNNQFLNSYKKKLGDRQAGDPQAGDPQAGDDAKSPATASAAEPASASDLESSPTPGSGVRPPESLHFEERSGFVQHRSTAGESKSPNRNRTGKTILIYLAVFLIIGAILGVIWYNSRNVEVLDLTNWTVNDAQLWAGDHDIKLQITEQYQDEFEEGKIFAQDAKPGTKIRKGSFLKISVSLGHDLSVTLELPDLMNMTKGEIEAWAAENYMTKVRITTEFSELVKSGSVIRFEINDNTVVDEVKRNTPIYVIISKGKEDTTAELVTIPDFKQMNIPQSNEFATENGLTLEINEVYDDYASAGSIFAQSVKAEEKVAVGTRITLSVSLGKKIILPSFAGYTKEKALGVANQLGISATVTEKYSSQPTGDFLSQSIDAGTIWKPGSFLELVYSLGNQVVLPSFVGQTQSAIETWAMDLNKQGASITIKAGHTRSNMPKDSIIYQNKSNTLIEIESTIRITVSLGKMIFTPDFVAPEGSGYDQAITRDMALQMCLELGIIPIFVSENNAARLPGEIWSQSVEAGREILEGSTITLTYRPADVTVVVPSFIGMTQKEIIAANYLKKFNLIFVLSDGSDTSRPDKVIEQSLRAATTVVSGSTITLTVNPPAPPVETTTTTTETQATTTTETTTEATTATTEATTEATTTETTTEATTETLA